MKAECIYDAQAILGECPRWHMAEARLYWVDIAKNALNRLNPETGENETRIFSQPIGCFAFCKGGGFLLAMQSGFFKLAQWDAEPVPFGAQIFADDASRRCNDGRTDVQGNFWMGSVNTAKTQANAALYRLTPQGEISCMETGMMTCNGAAFSLDGRFMHTDTPSHALHCYDIGQTGALSQRRLFHQFPLGQGRPDGGSFDSAGNYWSALFDGGRVVMLSQIGEIMAEVALPCVRPTMIAFGGEDGRTAFVTSARTGISDSQLEAQPLSGGIFSFRVDVAGVPEYDFG
jgi:sugar lactone lactonase YvrE